MGMGFILPPPLPSSVISTKQQACLPSRCCMPRVLVFLQALVWRNALYTSDALSWWISPDVDSEITGGEGRGEERRGVSPPSYPLLNMVIDSKTWERCFTNSVGSPILGNIQSRMYGTSFPSYTYVYLYLFHRCHLPEEIVFRWCVPRVRDKNAPKTVENNTLRCTM